MKKNNLIFTKFLMLIVFFSSESTQAQHLLAVPSYSSTQVITSLYDVNESPKIENFVHQTLLLQQSVNQFCGKKMPLSETKKQWLKSLLAWENLATPALGPLLTRRTSRSIDFWPTRPAMLEKAIASEPQNNSDLESIGSPAKGFPALEYILHSRQNITANDCKYMQLLSQEIHQESVLIKTEYSLLTDTDWENNPMKTQQAINEWLNQWLASVEKLRWSEIEKPIRSFSADKKISSKLPAFSRITPYHIASWQTQWQALAVQAQLSTEQKKIPPIAGKEIISIEAILLSKGHIQLAKKWSQKIEQVNQKFLYLNDTESLYHLLKISSALKDITVMFQNEVAAVLDLSLGFSDADGD